MQADQNNYQPDKQFTDKSWNDMLKTLDKEMPVQERKRRGFFWLFPLLLIGMIASVWAFYPQQEVSEIAQSKEVVINQTQTQTQTQKSKKSTERDIEIKSKNVITENRKTEIKKPQIKNNDSKFNDDFPSIIDSSNPLSPQMIEEIMPVENVEVNQQKTPFAKLREEVRTINSSFITLQLQSQEEIVIEEKEFFYEEEVIIKDPIPSNRKKEYGAYAGIVTDFANINEVGLTTGGFVHFPIRKKFGLRTGLGYSQLQKELPYSFIGNQEAALSPDFINTATATPPPFSTVAVQSNADFILEKFHQLDLPVLFTYSPIKKMQFQLGANASYMIKAKTRLINNYLNINDSANDDYSNYGIELDALDLNSISQNQYSDENYWTRLSLNGVAGFAWKPTRRINIELQYHYGFLPILKSSRSGNNDQAIITGSTTRGYEVYNNSADPNLSDALSLKNFFSKNKFIENNHSIRFTLGYNF